MTGLKTSLIFAAALTLAATGAAGAQEPSEPEAETGARQGPIADLTLSLGAAGLVAPAYEGSDETDFGVLPIIELEWKDRVFLNGRDGLGVKLLNGRHYTLSTSLGYSFGRDEDDSDDLEGLGDIDGGAVFKVAGELRYAGFSLAADFSHQVTGDDTGYLVNSSLGYGWRPAEGVMVRPAITTSYASGDYMEPFFGISPSQSARSGLPVFDADAGFKSVGAGLFLGYQIDPHWSVLGRLGYDRLIGDAADSPITQTEDQVSALFGVSYAFWPGEGRRGR